MEFFVGEGIAVGLSLVICAQAKFCSGGICQSTRTGGKIRVDMGFQNICDPQACALRVLEISIDIALGVDDCHGTAASDNVGILGKSRHIKTLENHLYSLSGIALN